MTEHEHDHDHDHDEESLEQALELDTQSQIFLEMRRQNLDLLKLSIEVAGQAGQVKSGNLKSAVKSIWELYSEFYSWIDPEESEGDEDEGDDEE